MESIIPFLETKHLVLEKLTLKHCKEYYLNWLHDSEVNFYLETGHFPLDLSQLENFIQGISKEEELRGLDVGEHGMESYAGFQIFSTE